MSVSVVLYKNLGVSNAAKLHFLDQPAGCTWPWVLKPLWSPVVDILKTRRQWIWAMQLLHRARCSRAWPRERFPRRIFSN
jgi:PAT family beta-lactamase induction signal transducer AmpG